jgi:hypothetical protein
MANTWNCDVTNSVAIILDTAQLSSSSIDVVNIAHNLFRLATYKGKKDYTGFGIRVKIQYIEITSKASQ